MKKIIFPKRGKKSHKGENGRVLVIGGNEIFHGAVILAGLGALESGADLIYLHLPRKYENLARKENLNFIIVPFHKNFLTLHDVPVINEWIQKSDVILIGNGIGEREETKKAVLKILKLSLKQNIPAVLDAGALFPRIKDIAHSWPWILTPHDSEFFRVFGKKPTQSNIKEMALTYKLVILKKGPIDFIADHNGKFFTNKSGTSLMSVGGTGDALAGLIAGLIAQKFDPTDACYTAAYVWGKCGEALAKKKAVLSAEGMLKIFPQVMKEEKVRQKVEEE